MLSSLKGQYAALERIRDPFLKRAISCAELTIPTLIPPKEHTSTTEYPTPHQSLGARGVNNLASKCLLTLLPPNTPFFKHNLDDFTLEKITKDEGLRSKVEESLGRIERAVMQRIETNQTRVSSFEALKHLFVGGNVLMHIQEKHGVRVFPLSRYVVKRDPVGTVIKMLTLELVAPITLDTKIRQACAVTPDDKGEYTDVEIYTIIARQDNKWRIYQEINERVVPDSHGTYPLEKCPWLALRLLKIDNEDYGRSYIEEYFGDLSALETLTKALLEGAVASSKVLFLVKPNGSTDAKLLDKAPNGAVREGNAEDVTVVQVNKFYDFKTVQEEKQSLKESLSYAFLLHSAIQRKGERVTAEEIRTMAGDLEDALGGIYSVLSQEWQLPLVKVIKHQMEMENALPTLPGGIELTITTGLEALGRGHDLEKLRVFNEMLSPFGYEKVAEELKFGDYVTRIGTALGMDIKGLVPTEEERAKKEQQDQMMAMMQQMLDKLGPEAMKQMGNQQQNPQTQQGEG